VSSAPSSPSMRAPRANNVSHSIHELFDRPPGVEPGHRARIRAETTALWSPVATGAAGSAPSALRSRLRRTIEQARRWDEADAAFAATEPPLSSAPLLHSSASQPLLSPQQRLVPPIRTRFAASEEGVGLAHSPLPSAGRTLAAPAASVARHRSSLTSAASATLTNLVAPRDAPRSTPAAQPQREALTAAILRHLDI
jgi:hypothetical protein